MTSNLICKILSKKKYADLILNLIIRLVRCCAILFTMTIIDVSQFLIMGRNTPNFVFEVINKIYVVAGPNF